MLLKRLPLLLALSCLSAPALADDFDTGWYIGGHAGYGNGSSDADVELGGQWSIEPASLRNEFVDAASTDLDPSGSSLGLQFGYLYTFADGFTLGAEVDWSALDIDDSRQTGPVAMPSFPSLTYDYGNSIELEDQASLRARLGYAFGGRHLIYATAGWTRVDAEASFSVTSNGNYLKAGGADEALDGVVWGVGYEFGLGNGWSMRAEYLATDVEDFEYTTAYLPGSSYTTPPYTETVDQDVDFDVFRVGFNYHF